MPELITISRVDYDHLQERARTLADEKSQLQLIIQLMNCLSTTPGLEHTIQNMLTSVLDVIGGTNLKLYYRSDGGLYYADACGKAMPLEALDDELARVAFETRTPVQRASDFGDTQLTTLEFSQAHTCAFPLLVGSELIGVLKMENLHVDLGALYPQLPVFINYAALILKNEISSATRLKEAHDRLCRANAELTNEIHERQRAEADLREAKAQLELRVAERTAALGSVNERLTALYGAITDAIYVCTVAPDGTPAAILDVNDAACRMLGYSREELLSLSIVDIDAPESTTDVRAIIREIAGGRDVLFEQVHVAKDGRRIPVEVHAYRLELGGTPALLSTVRDISERKQAEQEREALIELLRLLNTSEDTHLLLRSTTAFLSRIADCEAVGVRLRDGEDFPYFETHGFPAEFVRVENRLCALDERGELVRDSAGNPVLECMCGNILCGRFDPSKPFFTPAGSFWTNSTSGLLASTTETERQARTRNRCNGEGYESVALLPLRVGESTIGLLQLNDHRPGRFTPQKIAMLERFVGHLAIGLAHRRAEAELRESEECYRTVADFTYDWEYWIAPDGKIRYCSPACERITGYRAEEFAREPSLLTGIVHPDDRARVLAHHRESLHDAATPLELEYRIRRRDGEERWISHACQPVRGGDGTFLGRRVSDRDVTERKRIERVNVARLRLVQFAATHSLDELLEATLNEAEELTGSLIGFYHFVEADQKTLALQNWSTRTKAEFCTAEGKGLHYAITDAGVWVDCVHERRPVIHNDYAALPHRKGMPPGHASVVRELLVPVFRGDQVVAILGVGNKPQDYGTADVETVSLLADLAWDIAGRMRAEVELRRVNRALRTVSDCNQAVIRATGEAELLAAVCRVAIESGEYRAAWVGYAEEDAAHSVRPHAQAGLAAGVLEALEISWDDTVHGRSTLAQAIQTGQACVARRADDDPVLARWREREGSAAPVCSLTLPLCVSGKPLGTLTIYADVGDAFDARETELLGEMAGDLAYGIETQRTRAARARAEAERKRTQDELQRSNELLRAVIEAAPTAIIGLDLDGNVQTVWNPAAERMLGWSAPEVLGHPLPTVPAESQDEFARFRDQIRAGLTLDGVEVRRQKRDGTPIDYCIYASPLHDVEGRISGNVAVLVDVTERKRMAQEVTRLASFPMRNPQPIVEVDATGRVSFANPAARRLFADLDERGCDHPWLVDWQRLAAACRGEETIPLEREVAVAGRWYHQSLFLVPEERRLRIYGLDITDRRRAEAELRARTEELDHFFSLAPDLLCIANTDGYFLRLSPSWERTLGYSSAELRAQPFVEFVHPDDRTPTHDALAALAAQRGVYDFVNRYRCADGTYRWLEWRSAPVGTRVYAAARDVTQRKRAEQALRDSEQRWRSLLQAVEVGVVIHDPQTRVVASNPAAQAVLGLTEQQVLGKAATDPAWRFVQEDGAPMPVEQYPVNQVVAGGRAVRSLVLGVVRPDRPATTWTLVNADPVLNPDGTLREVIVAFMDITERKRAEEALRISERRFGELFNRAAVPLCLINKEGAQLDFNERFRTTFGYVREEVPTLNEWWQLAYPDPAYREWAMAACEAAIQRSAQTGADLVPVEYRVTCKNGESRNMVVSGSAIGPDWLLTFFDVTERKKAEVQLLRSERQKTILNQIAGIMLTTPDEAMFGDVLTVILDILNSKHGIFGYVADDGNLVVPSLTRDVWRECQVSDKSIVFPPSSWGDSLWGRAILERTSFVSAGPFHTPAGHLPVANFLTTPVVFGDRSIGLLCVANRAAGYTRDDTALLENIAEYLAPILNARLQRDRHEQERRRAEERVAAQLREKELLLREIHHRVKNNMQVISSLLDLQTRQAGSEGLRTLLSASRGRIRTMALVHERLYAAQDMARVDLREYVQALVAESLSLYGVDPRQVEVHVSVEQWALGIATAIPCGLIIHELLSNALRHAFPGGRSGRVEITLARTAERTVELTVQDNGVGLPKGLTPGAARSLGLRLVQILAVDQLGGAVRLERDQGTKVQVRFAEAQS